MAKRSTSQVALKKSSKRFKASAKAKPVKVNLGRQPIAQQSYRTFTYVDQSNISIASGVGFYQFRCNGLFDPNATGGGSQPMYFDQIMALYNHYTVLSSKITVSFSDRFDRIFIITLYVDDDTTIDSNAIQSAARPGAKSVMTLLNDDRRETLTMKWDARSTFGGNPQSKAELTGTSGTNPSEQSYFTVAIKDLQLNDNNLTMYTKIEYYVVLDEFKTVNPS